jgi:hypothetical protein
LKKIIVWERYDPENKTWKHNHISYTDDGDKPVGDIQQTKTWSKYTWQRIDAYLDSNYKVIQK